MELKDCEVVINKMGVRGMIDILGVRYEIKTVVDKSENNQLGYNDNKDRVIYLNNDMVFGTYIETLWHEIVHVIMDRCGITASLGEKHIEIVAEMMGCMLPVIIHQNSWLRDIDNG